MIQFDRNLGTVGQWKARTIGSLGHSPRSFFQKMETTALALTRSGLEGTLAREQNSNASAAELSLGAARGRRHCLPY